MNAGANVTDNIQESFDKIPVYSKLQPYLEISFFGNTVAQYLIAITIFIILWILLKVFRTIILIKLESLSHKTKTNIDNELIGVLKGIKGYFYAYLSFYLTLKTITVNPTLDRALDGILILLVILQAARIFAKLVELLLSKADTEPNPTVVNGLKLVTTLSIWLIGILMILSNLGFEITALAASLGIGGIAVALAAQNILGDLFSSFSIYIDKPFEIGDFIIIQDDLGVVKKIGMKTTRIQTLRGEELVISNQELTSTRILNFKKMERRRVQFNFGVEYSTGATKLEKIPQIVKKIIEDTELADFDRSHFMQFGDSSLNFESIYYVNSADYNVYMDTQQKIFLDIVKTFEKEAISMAFPTRTVHLVKE